MKQYEAPKVSIVKSQYNSVILGSGFDGDTNTQTYDDFFDMGGSPWN